MITIRKSADRGAADHGWLQSFHTFSFADYHDPKHVHFRDLRVINEDKVAPGQGFGTHPHDNMEIITVVLSGDLAHRDSMGHVQSILPGDVQVMSAGTGVTHSEYNHSDSEWVHLLQIWIIPSVKNVTPRYDQKRFECVENGLKLVVSGDGRDRSLMVHQDVELFRGKVSAGHALPYEILEGRSVWIQMISGELIVNDASVFSGDGVSVSHETLITLLAKEDAEFLLFDLV